MYPDKFDTSKLTSDDRKLLQQLLKKRQLFDAYLENSNPQVFTCPSCGYPAFTVRGGYEICSVCNWEDDNQDDEQADEIWGGPNGNLSLTESRLNIERTLRKLSEELHGNINTNPEEIIRILENHDKRMNEIRSSIPIDADLTHIGWIEWKNAEKALLTELISNRM